MAKVTIFAGYCGSGKSCKLKQLKKKYLAEGKNVCDFKEVFYQDSGAEKRQMISDRLNKGIDCLVEEANCCFSGCRDCLENELKVANPELEVEWYLFEDNIDIANKNVVIRTNESKNLTEIEKTAEIKRLHDHNQNLSKQYDFPEGYKPKPIYRKSP